MYSGAIVEQLTEKKPVYNLDPVLTYDYMNCCDKIPQLRVDEKYLILYAYAGRISNEEADWIAAYAKKKNLKVYAIGGIQKCADRFVDCSPFEVLAYFRNAEEVITDTFHGSIFSVITHRPFTTLIRKSVGNSYGNEEKLSDLLERLDLADRMTAKVEDTKMIANLLDEIEVRLSTDYLENKAELDALADKVVYTGPIDAYFDYKLGTLEYRSVRFETETLDKPNFQGNAAVNYTDRETPWTRIIEHKWFEFGKDENGNDLPKTIISREYSSEWKPGDEPYYPVNDAKNGLLYSEYKKLADAENNVIFGGRLGEYKYYDMDQVIAAVLDRCEKEF